VGTLRLKLKVILLVVAANCEVCVILRLLIDAAVKALMPAYTVGRDMDACAR
jgi:hypothetical protein